MDLDDPASNAEWMKFRWDAITDIANELAKEIRG